MNKDLIKLIRIIQKQVVSILLVRGLVTLIDKNGPLSFSNIKVTKQGSESINEEDLVTDEQVEIYKNLWPKGFRGSTKAVKEKMTRFLIEHDCTFEQICSSAKKWLSEKETPYHGNADYFFYKNDNGSESSRCEEYLTEEEDVIDFRNLPS